MDLLGHGTACLVWSSPLPGDAGRQVRYVDLMAAGKPYLLTGIVNNLGAETVIGYCPSTKFYLADRAAGRPWLTRLPFPVHVVERVQTVDRVNRNRFTTRHAYHHGYFDGSEREFRGFGMAEQWDTEELAVLHAGHAGSGEFTNQDAATDVPPVLTRTWLHTGVFPGEDGISGHFAREYWRPPDGGGPDLPRTALPTTLRRPGGPPRPWRLSPTEALEACRALKGMPLREEVYALDGSEAASRPYLVTEHNYTVELLQPALAPIPDGPQNCHAVLFTHPRESVTAHYERVLYPGPDGELRADPRITHDVVLAADDFGNPLRKATAAYGRRHPDPALAPADQAVQARLRLAFTDSGYTNAVELPDAHRTPLPASVRDYEAVGLRPAGRLFGFGELRDGLDAITAEVPFQDWDADPAALPGPGRRLTGHTAVRYRRDDLSGPLPPGVLESLALPYRSDQQAFTDSLVDDLYAGAVDEAMLLAAGYRHDGSVWWLPSGRVFLSPGTADGPEAELDYARRHFFVPRRFTDPFGNVTGVDYDRYDLLVRQTRDPLGNLVTAGERDPGDRITSDGNDYRVLAPRLISDVNRNRSAVAFDVLGRVAGTAVMGKPEEDLGDTLDGFGPDPSDSAVEDYFADPFAHAHALLGRATSRVLYDPDRYRHSAGRQPAAVSVVVRQTHVSDLEPGRRTGLQLRFAYCDGFGREIQHKEQAAPGPVTDGGPAVGHRWVAGGWTVFNNKGRPVRTYEPFFTAAPGFEFAVTAGVGPVLFYDPAGRVVASLTPDGAYVKTTFDPWYSAVWDAADTVLLDPRHDPDVAGFAGRYLAVLSGQPGGWATWYARRADGSLGRSAQRAAAQSALHAAGTPKRAWSDALGQTFLTVEHNRVPAADSEGLTDQFCRTLSLLDIQGNQHEVHDALGRVAMRYGYAMIGSRVTTAGMDSGGGGTLPDVLGRPVYGRNSRGFVVRTEYDALRRPVRRWVSGPGIDGAAAATLTEYGESLEPADDAQARNLRGRVARLHDGAGISVNAGYDFKGNLLGSARRLAASCRDIALDWSGDVPLEPREYVSATAYDALSRPTALTTPDGSVQLPAYDAAGRLERLTGRLRGAGTVTTFIEKIEYDAHGRRTLVRHGNGTSTAYSYDPLTFRLTRLLTLRGHRRLQDLRHTYDPVGNPTRISDRAQQDTFFRNQVVSPTSRYVYDAMYRLIEATGREHPGQTAGSAPPSPPGPRNGAGTPPVDQPGDGSAMARYTERYTYDEVGNMLLIRHRSSDPARGGWTRSYEYEEPSLSEPGRSGNRLSATGPARSPAAPPRLGYDEQGNTTSMPELPLMSWDYADRLHATSRHAEPAAHGESAAHDTTYYGYDAAGRRVRKVTERARAGRKHERLYLGALEIFRAYAPDGSLTLERETLNIFDEEHRTALVETRTAGTDPGASELIRYQLTNHLDSSVLELDQSAGIISYEEYHPYGSTAYQAVRSRTEAPERYRYTGKERDDETGFSYHGARYYVPWLARWSSCDPAGLQAGPDPYVYAAGNPVANVDRTGREPEPYHTLPGWSGNEPWRYFLGRAVHMYIADSYRAEFFAESAATYTNYTPIASILKATGGDPGKLTEKQQGLKPDITNTRSREVFEIKPDSPPQFAAGKSQVNAYRDALNAGSPANRQYILGSDFSGEGRIRFDGGRYDYRLTWRTATDAAKKTSGVILYKIERLNPKDDSKESWKEAYDNNAWVVPSDAELAALDIEATYNAMVRRQKISDQISKTESIVDIPIAIIGTVMTAILSASIFSGTSKQPAPGARSGVPVPAPAPAATAPPPVVPSRPVVPPAPANVPPPYQIPPPPPPPAVQPQL
jgi:RHS repeat-associated protein